MDLSEFYGSIIPYYTTYIGTYHSLCASWWWYIRYGDIMTAATPSVEVNNWQVFCLECATWPYWMGTFGIEASKNTHINTAKKLNQVSLILNSLIIELISCHFYNMIDHFTTLNCQKLPLSSIIYLYQQQCVMGALEYEVLFTPVVWDYSCLILDVHSGSEKLQQRLNSSTCNGCKGTCVGAGSWFTHFV